MVRNECREIAMRERYEVLLCHDAFASSVEAWKLSGERTFRHWSLSGILIIK